MPKKFDLLVFDWDGTLMDSADAIVEALQSACQDLRLPVPEADQARYIITTSHTAALEAAGVPVKRIGTTGGDAIRVDGKAVALTDLRKAHEGFFPALMEA